MVFKNGEKYVKTMSYDGVHMVFVTKEVSCPKNSSFIMSAHQKLIQISKYCSLVSQHSYWHDKESDFKQETS